MVIDDLVEELLGIVVGEDVRLEFIELIEFCFVFSEFCL